MKNRGTPNDTYLIWRVTSRVILGIGAISALFTLSYWIQTWLLAWSGWHTGQYLSHMITVALGLVLLIIGGAVTSRIVTPRQNALWQSLFEALRRMAQELGQLERMRQEFISNVSHEIQSPLTSITGFATALQNEDLSEEQRQGYLHIIESESMWLSRLSDNLLKLTSLESGYHPFRPETYRLDRQLRDSALALEPMWTEKSIQFDVAVPATLFHADKDLVNQVWMNLLTNAIKFTPPHGCISIGAEVDNERVAVRIADSGIGFSEAERERIFERFYKADKARAASTSGAGLGLSIVKKIVELHQGTIEVNSGLGIGSTFTVSFPLTAMDATEVHTSPLRHRVGP